MGKKKKETKKKEKKGQQTGKINCA